MFDRKPFLTAEWRGLAMLNYSVAPAVLEPFVPRGTVLDAFLRTACVSMVGFLVLNTKAFLAEGSAVAVFRGQWT